MSHVLAQAFEHALAKLSKAGHVVHRLAKLKTNRRVVALHLLLMRLAFRQQRLDLVQHQRHTGRALKLCRRGTQQKKNEK